MATLKLFFLLAACAYAHALPNPPLTRNTIFLDEKLEGEIFENIDAYNELSTADVQSYRLPTTTRPISYTVLWAVDTTNLVFSGNVSIEIQATQANANEIVLHAHDMELTSVVLQRGDIIIPQTHRLEYEHFLKVSLTSGVLEYNATNPIQYTLKIDFNSNLRDDMYGIYKTWFKNNPTDENVRWMASTQFQATAARFAFPCYDEPGFKATFDVTIRRPTTYKSWFCTTVIDRRNVVANFEDDVYATTPIMSTYLLAIIVAEYESLIQNETNEFYYEVIGRPGALNITDINNQGKYALDTGKNLTDIMNVHTAIDYFSVHENLVKMTHAAIPDFSAGAMENWGLITYREAYLFYDEAHTNYHFKQLIAYILSHEIAHMWFGNLVTCDFWDNLWLNEGFARYYQYFLTDKAEPEMGFSTRFITEQVHTSLLADSAENAHPLTNLAIGSASSVRTMFSTISYNKGAAIIRMTEHLLGTEVHEAGLRNYLKEREFKTAEPIHLFQALQNAAVASGAISQYGNFSVIDYYRSWTEQNGHPVLFVEVNHQTGQIIVTQRRFSINTGYATNNLQYIVPITFATAQNPDFDNLKPSHIISNIVSVIDRGSIGDQWVIFNKQQTGFYRVNYDDYTWDLIVIALRGPQRTAIHEYNRAQIVNDVFQFARAGIMSYNRAFNILSFLREETDYAPWLAAVTGFNWLQNRLVGTEYQAQLENLLVEWSEKVIAELTYLPIEGESFMRTFLRFQLAPVVCRLNVRLCRESAAQQFRDLVGGTEVTVNNRPWVYCNALREGGREEFDFLWNRYMTHNVYTEKIMILQNIGCTNDAQSLNSFLTSIIRNNTEVRPQDYSAAFNSALTGNEANTRIVLEFIQNNVVEVLQSIKVSAFTNTIARLRTPEDINAFQSWATTNQAQLGSDAFNSVQSSITSTRQGLTWYTTISEDLEDYFENADVVITSSSSTAAPVTEASTVTAPSLIQQSTPQIPDSAITSALSIIALTVAVAVNIIV